jgi:hypothetical protein
MLDAYNGALASGACVWDCVLFFRESEREGLALTYILGGWATLREIGVSSPGSAALHVFCLGPASDRAPPLAAVMSRLRGLRRC